MPSNPSGRAEASDDELLEGLAKGSDRKALVARRLLESQDGRTVWLTREEVVDLLRETESANEDAADYESAYNRLFFEHRRVQAMARDLVGVRAE